MRLIDADALMADLEKWLKQIDPTHPSEDNSIPPMEDIIVSTLMTIEEQPTIEPQRMRGKGRWNAYYHGEENGKSIFSYSCNQCGYGAPYNFIGGVCEQKKWNFCPNCGAWMGGQEC